MKLTFQESNRNLSHFCVASRYCLKNLKKFFKVCGLSQKELLKFLVYYDGNFLYLTNYNCNLCYQGRKVTINNIAFNHLSVATKVIENKKSTLFFLYR